MFVARPPVVPSGLYDLHLVRAGRRTFTGPARFLDDSENRARVGEYLADMGRPYGRALQVSLFGEPPFPGLGHSYGEMAAAVIGSVVPAEEPADLLVLAFSVHDLRPGRQTAGYLSHITPGEPVAFAVCDQGSAAAFSGLQMARAYAASAGIQRVLLVVAEQAALPYESPAALPSRHRAVAMLYTSDPSKDDASAIGPARVTGIRQHPGVAPGEAAALADADLEALAAGQPAAGLVLSAAAAAVWPAPAWPTRAAPPGQPGTDVWWELIDELGRPDAPDPLVLADYDPRLRYLCLAAFRTGPRAG